MQCVIKIKSSSIAGRVPLPSDLVIGELALNTNDGKLFFKNNEEVVKEISSDGRDFTQNPLNLQSEVSGVLSINNIEEINSANVNLANTESLFQNASTVEEALNYLFTSANSVKQRIISAIGNPLEEDDTTRELVDKITNIKSSLSNNLTFKGIPILPDDDLSSMVDVVRNIVTHSVNGVFTRSGIIVLSTASTFEIPLAGTIDEFDFCASLLEFIDGNKDVVFIDFKFDDTGRSIFSTNPQVVFDNGAKINSTYIYPMAPVDTWDDGGDLLVLDGSLFSPLESIDSLVLLG